MPQTSNTGRVVNLVAIEQGNCFVAAVGDTTWTAANNTTGDSPPLNFTGTVESAVCNQIVYFADGSNQVLYDPSTNTVKRWTASAGSLPTDSDNNTARLICNWRNRIVLAGLFKSGQAWFMSRKDQPTDWDYGPLNPDPTQPVAGTFQAPQGLVSENITSLCPFSNDVLIVFCSNSIYMFAGDPADGGDIQLVTRSIGGTFGKCWAMDSLGVIYFFSNRTGVYRFVPGQAPQRISQPIDPLLRAIDTGANNVRLEYEEACQAIHVFISPLAAPAAATHYIFELRTGSWFQEVFANNDHNPLASCTIDGNLEGDRVLVIGSWSGYVFFFDPNATDDDGTPIQSEVLLGPIVSPDFSVMMIRDLVCDLALDSGDVSYSVLVGDTAEDALAATPVESGTWSAGRNFSTATRRADHAAYVRLSSSNRFAFERLRATVGGRGPTRARGK